MTRDEELFISVDIETSGPVPGEYSMLSIGACVIFDVSRTFACELKPISAKSSPDAIRVSGLSLEKLAQTGLTPRDAMSEFSEWLLRVCMANTRPIFVGFNAPFDWSFVNYYFHKYIGMNPFGFAALDIKALYMGVTGCRWDDTRSSKMAERLKPELSGTHNALSDALYQAEMYRLIWSERMRH